MSEVLEHKLMVADVSVMGMPLKRYKFGSCVADVAEDKDWATIYSIQSLEQGKGHATKLLTLLKDIYKDKEFGGTIALNPVMKHIYQKLNIKEYDE